MKFINIKNIYLICFVFVFVFIITMILFFSSTLNNEKRSKTSSSPHIRGNMILAPLGSTKPLVIGRKLPAIKCILQMQNVLKLID